MARREIILEVKVIETDENGNVTATHCQHREHHSSEWAFANKDELMQWAYKGFNLARNGFVGVPEKED
jgi:hypothetical protein